jgi:hypothetical protein
MMRSIGFTSLFFCLFLSGTVFSQTQGNEFDKTIQGAKEYSGLFKLYQKEDKLYAEIQTSQLNKPFLCPIAIARGMGMGGHTLNSDEQWVLLFKKVGEKVHLVRRNVHFRARQGSPVSHAVDTTYTDSVLLALRIVATHPARRSLLINFNDIFMTNFARLNAGRFDASRSTWHKIKVFPRNVELEVAATYAGGRGGDSVIDPRGNTVVIHYGLCELPGKGYQPRLADDRVGHFLSVVKDYTEERDTSFLRYINRWRVERAEPVDSRRPNRLSPPKKKIVFWIEKSVPYEYREYVREGILEWNKAFEQIGFRDVIEVRQQESEEFDPEDINYNTFRWITSDRGFAMGPSRANPLTGEIIDADIIFDASMVRFYRQEAESFGQKSPTAMEVISPIRTARLGLDLPGLDTLPGFQGSGNDREETALAQRRLHAIRQGLCRCGSSMKRELHLLTLALLARGQLAEENPTLLPEKLIGQAIKETTMHEVGHTLGLRHNFKGSTMLPNEQLHDPAITQKRGLVGSVMDYAPINLAPKGTKQGDYFTTTLGPYDYWAIEYAYKPLSGGTEGEYEKLQEISKRCAQPGYDYGTDEDLYTSSDPLVNVWDLGADPMQFAQNRLLLAKELMKDLAKKGATKGEGYQRVRQSFNLLLQEYGNAAYLVSCFVGGVSMHRDHHADPKGRDPLVPVPPDKQRSALKFLQTHLLADQAFHFSPELLRRLAADRWWHWGNDGVLFSPVEFPIHERLLAIQRVVLEQLLDPRVLAVAEIFRALTDGVWGEQVAGAGGEHASTILRRNLQREYLRALAELVLGKQSRFRFVPPDARSLARMHLREIGKRIDQQLKAKNPGDDTTRAHLEESRERIDKVLAASLQISEP